MRDNDLVISVSAIARCCSGRGLNGKKSSLSPFRSSLFDCLPVSSVVVSGRGLRPPPPLLLFIAAIVRIKGDFALLPFHLFVGKEKIVYRVSSRGRASEAVSE